MRCRMPDPGPSAGATRSDSAWEKRQPPPAHCVHYCTGIEAVQRWLEVAVGFPLYPTSAREYAVAHGTNLTHATPFAANIHGQPGMATGSTAGKVQGRLHQLGDVGALGVILGQPADDVDAAADHGRGVAQPEHAGRVLGALGEGV